MSLTIEERKRTGSYYTSAAVARFLAAISVRSPRDRVLEPCFGEGVFLDGVWRRCLALSQLEQEPDLCLVGVDADGRAVAEGRERFPFARLVEADFFTIEPGQLGRFDVVIGNPPFVRYHRFRGAERELALKRCEAAGVELPALASAWAPFLIHATQQLAPGGRMAVVAPLELTYARYARPFVRFLCRHFDAIRVFLFDEPLFPELNEATVLLVAEGWGGSCAGLELIHLQSEDDLNATDPFRAAVEVAATSGWADGGAQPRLYRLPERVRGLYRELEAQAVRLGDIADLTIGYVTGANDWFHLTNSEVRYLALQRDVRLALRRSADLRGLGLSLTDGDRERLATTGARWLFYPEEPLSAEAAEYIRLGEGAGVHRAYKCRVRDPWWRVPGVRSHDFVLGVLSAGAPRIVVAGLPATNSLLVGDLQASVDPRALAAASLTSFAALSAEVAGHPLGGGALKLEPAEARRWALLFPFQGAHVELDLIDRLLRQGDASRAMDEADRLFLMQGLGLRPSEIETLRGAAHTLREARMRRRAD